MEIINIPDEEGFWDTRTYQLDEKGERDLIVPIKIIIPDKENQNE